jgi:hypothetical protein
MTLGVGVDLLEQSIEVAMRTRPDGAGDAVHDIGERSLVQLKA